MVMNPRVKVFLKGNDSPDDDLHCHNSNNHGLFSLCDPVALKIVLIGNNNVNTE